LEEPAEDTIVDEQEVEGGDGNWEDEPELMKANEKVKHCSVKTAVSVIYFN
jgi:hypothetical protein